MLGGVGGVRSNAAPIPIRMVSMEAAAPLRGLNPPVPKLGIQLDRTSGFTKRCELENLRPNRSFQFFDLTRLA